MLCNQNTSPILMKRIYLLLLLIYLPTQTNAELCAYNRDGSPLTWEDVETFEEDQAVFWDVADCTAEGAAGSKRDNRVYAGLVWTFGKTKNTFVPDISLGYSSLKVKSDSDVNGFDVGVRFGLSGQGIKLDSTRASYVDGDRNLMSHYGVGYSFSHSDFMATVAAQKSHLKLGADLLLSSQTFVPYLEINSLDKPDRDSGSCDGRFLPNGALGDNPEAVGHLNEDGSTCANDSMTYLEFLGLMGEDVQN